MSRPATGKTTFSRERLTRFPLFSELPDERLRQIAGFVSRSRHAKGSLIIAAGEPASAFFLVEYGQVKVYACTPDGRERILHIVKAGETFAEVAVLSMENYPASAMALEDTALIGVPRAAFHRLLASSAEATRAMLAGQARWIRYLVDLNAELTLDDVQSRLARYLVRLAAEQGVELEDGALLDLTQKKTTIAAQIGTVAETLSRNFAKLEGQGVILRESKRVRILDAGRLHDLAGP